MTWRSKAVLHRDDKRVIDLFKDVFLIFDVVQKFFFKNIEFANDFESI